MAERLRVLERRERVGRLARLADDDDQRTRMRDAVAIAVLARDLDLRRNLRDRFEPVLRGQPGVVARAAGQDQHRVDRLERGFGASTVARGVEQPRADRTVAIVGDPFQRVGDRARLLEDLLLHVMAIRAELGRAARRIDDADLALDRPVVAIGDPPAAELDVDGIAVVEIDEVVGYARERHRVRCEEALTLNRAAAARIRWRATEHERRAVTGADDPMRLFAAEHRDRIRAVQSLDGCPRRIEQVAVVQRIDQVSDHFGVRLADEHITARDQFDPQRVVILDDAVVDQRDPSRLVRRREVRMRVGRGRRAVRGPAGVGDAGEAGQRALADLRVELGHAGDAARAFRPERVINCHAAGVVSPIFEPLQPFDEDRDDVPRADGADDSAHPDSPS